MAYTVHKAVRGGDGHHRFGAGVRGLDLTAVLGEEIVCTSANSRVGRCPSCWARASAS